MKAVGQKPLAMLILIVFCTLVNRVAFGQAVSGNIEGTVTDPSEAAIPSAEVTIRDLDRGLSYETKTNTDGNYVQTHLLAGHYEVQVRAPGFAEFLAKVVVQVDATARVDAALTIQKAGTEVTVTAEAPLMKMDRPEVSANLTGGEIDKLPVLDRNLTQLILIMPGAQENGWQHASSENPQGGIQIDANGQFFFSNGFLLDGTENNSSILGIAVVVPNFDSMEEFKVSTSNYDAEFGSVSGALIHATTKSGTNQVHGTLFEFLRNSALNAADPFSGLKPPIRWNQFGGSFAGPLRKDKLFGFFDYQGTRRRTGGSLISTVPNAAERSGDLTAFLGDYICADGTTSATPCAIPVTVSTTEGGTTAARAGLIFDPSTGNPDGTGRSAFTSGGQPNIIPVAGPIANLMNSLPMPNFGSPGDFANNYVSGASEKFDSDQYDGRVDWNISSKQRLFGRYTIADFTKQSPGAYGLIPGGPSPFGFAGQSLVRNQSFALGWTYTLSPTLITDFRFGAFRYRVFVQPNGIGTTPATDAGLPGLNLGTAGTSGMPAFTIDGNGGFAFGYSLGVNQCNCPLRQIENHFQWVNNWTKQSGNHMLKWGMDFRRGQQLRIPSDDHRSGESEFTEGVTGDAGVDLVTNGSAPTGLALASFLLGKPSSFDRFFTGIGYTPGLRQTRLFFFGEDTWRATPKLTLSYGLRYENYLPQTAAHPGGAGMFDPTTGEMLAAGIGSVPANMGVKAYNRGFVPRLGVAYEWRPKTVIRAGYGHSYNPSALGAIFGENPELNPPINNPQVLSQPNAYTPAFSLLTGPPLPVNPVVGSDGRFPLQSNLSVFFYFFPLDSYRVPMVQFWNVSVQHQFSPDTTLDIAYVGNVGRHLYVNPATNQAVPGPGDLDPRRPFFKLGITWPIFGVCNCDTSNYNSLQVKLQKRVAHGLDFLATYTWSKAMTHTEGGYSYDNAYDFKGVYGPAGWDHTHALTLVHAWDLPFGKGRRWASDMHPVVDGVIGGWRFSGITTLLSGPAFTPSISFAPLLNTDFSGVRPDIIGNPHVSSPNRGLWFNPNAYTAPQQPFSDGTASKGSLRGPAEYVFDLSLSKDFRIAEGKTLEFRWENFNAFNHTNLGLPDATVDDSTAGVITGLVIGATMRQMQLGLHFHF